jgi:hypothetical protein
MKTTFICIFKFVI